MKSYREVLGRATWKFLHLYTMGFTSIPKVVLKKLRKMIYIIGDTYPCDECKVNFQKILRKYKPDFKNGNGFRKYMCFVHNKVNKQIGKPQFDCNKI